MNALPSIRATLQNNTDDGSLVKRLAENTSRPFRVPASITASNFHTLYTGDNLRWEFLGTIFAMAGLAAQLTSSEHPTSSLNDASTNKSRLITCALAASNSCISICQYYSSVNDIMLWLLSTNLLLLCNVRGDSDHSVWRRMGDVATDIFALGWHQGQSASIPFFLAESRKRLFAATYRNDKSLASFLGRPPRIPKRYCTLVMPYDLSDADLMEDESALMVKLTTMDQYGWSTDKRLKPAAWIRLRFQQSIFREDILELSQGTITDEKSEKLQTVSRESHASWDSLPSSFKYSENCWDSSPSVVCLMLLVVYLEYLSLDFQIFRHLRQHTPSVGQTLHDISMKILETLQTLTRKWTHMDEVRKNFSWLFLFYGFPSAAVLLTELSKRRFDPSIIGRGDVHTHPTPSTVVRKIYALLSFTESFAFSDIDGNYDLCQSATRRIEKILNDILDQPAVHASSSTPLLHPVDSSQPDEFDINEVERYPPSSFVPSPLDMNVGSMMPTEASSQEMDDWSTQNGFFANWIENMEWADLEDPHGAFSPQNFT